MLPLFVFAQQGQYDDLKIQDVFNIVSGLVCWLFNTAGLLLVIFAIVAGVKFLTSGSNAAQAGEARKALLQVFIAAIVIFGAGVIIVSVANFLGANVSITPLSC
ncbi:MAG: hypothetical protein Q8Q06_04495 [bacterium]|nr:hypothetical protein [bacterium]